MEKTSIKCSSKEHMESDAICYCQICQIYMCNKCEKLHSGLFTNHHLYKLEHDNDDIFSGICQKENHLDKLDYFCKNHNMLCCAACISKIKGKGNGQHTDCTVCFIEDIKEHKKNNLNENIQSLENLSHSLSRIN